MTRRLLTAPALAALLLLPALLRADDPPKGDKDLDGTWEVVSLRRDDKELGTPPGAKLLQVIKGSSMTTKIADQSRTATIVVDTSKTPRAIDVTPDEGPDKGKPALGVYELKGDELRLCWADLTKDRPTDFTAKEGSGWTLMTLKRVKK